MHRRDSGKETWHRLLGWDKSSGDAERLAAQILSLEGFTEVNPSHPLGGSNGKRDIVLSKNGNVWIAAVYFPRGQKKYAEIKEKYKNDAQGVKKHTAEGLTFVTNQELKLGEREALQREFKFKTEIYHLERMASILNQPKAYGIRLEFLNIEMSKEEQLSALACRDDAIQALTNKIAVLIENKQKTKKYPVEVTPELVNTEINALSCGFGTKLHFCSSCGFGYKIKGSDYTLPSLMHFGPYSITCPKCGNTEYYNTPLF